MSNNKEDEWARSVMIGEIILSDRMRERQKEKGKEYPEGRYS